MIKDLEKKLKKYCSKEKRKGHLAQPFYQGGQICATDRHVALLIKSPNIGLLDATRSDFPEYDQPNFDAIIRPTGQSVKLSVKRLKDALAIFNDKVQDEVVLTLGADMQPIRLYQESTSAEVLLMPLFN